MRGLASAHLLRDNRDFRRLFFAAIASMAGDWFAFVALADLVSQLTHQRGASAFVFAATVLPMFFAAPFAGAAADRFDRKRLLVAADLVRVPLALLLCGAAAWGSAPLAYGVLIALGLAASFHDPVTSAVMPNLVAAKDLSRAQALLGAVWGGMLFLGAGLGGLVAELLGMQVAFIVNAASFAISAWLIAGIEKPMQEARAGERRADGGIGEVLRYIVRDRVVRRLVLAKFGVSSANGTVGLLPAFAHERFAGTSVATGLLLSARGVGAMLGPFLARWLGGPTPGPRMIIVMCGASTLLYVAIYAVLPLVTVFALAMLLVVIAHLGGGAQWSLSTYGLQVATPDAMRGRVMSIDYGLATLVIGISALIAGMIANATSAATATWWLCGAGLVYAIGWTLWALRGTPATVPAQTAAEVLPADQHR